MFQIIKQMRVLQLSLMLMSLAMCASAQERRGYGQEWANEYLNEVLSGKQIGIPSNYNFVLSEEVAIKIAVAVWEPIYGKEHIAKQAPYFAYEVKGYWVVQGTLPPAPTGHIVVGGTAKAIIEKRTGKVIHVIHHE
jgi:hypothetical protein